MASIDVGKDTQPPILRTSAPVLPGQLHAVSLLDGRVRSIDLPAPAASELTAAPWTLWPDPSRPGSLLVAYAFQYFEQLASDWFYTASYDRFLARLDVATGAWTELLHTDPWALDPSVWPLGVTRDGRLVLRIDLEDDAALLGTLDAESAELRVSSSLCLSRDDYPWLVIGDTVYETDQGDEIQVWTPYLLGP